MLSPRTGTACRRRARPDGALSARLTASQGSGALRDAGALHGTPQGSYKPATLEGTETVPERVYMNRRTGEERIHIEITRAEITEMLDRPTNPATRRFWELLAEAENQFDAGQGPSLRPAAETSPHRPPCIEGDHCGELLCPPLVSRRQLTELEHGAAWHAIDGLDWEAYPDADTVLNAVLRALDIDPPQPCGNCEGIDPATCVASHARAVEGEGA